MSVVGMARRRAHPYDVDLELRDRGAAALAATTAQDPIELIVGANDVFKVVVDYGAIGGTVDGSNNWTVNVQISDEVAGTYQTIATTGVLQAAAGQVELSVTGLKADYLESDAGYIRAQAVRVGTPGNLSYGAFITTVM